MKKTEMFTVMGVVSGRRTVKMAGQLPQRITGESLRKGPILKGFSACE
ncbi:MAG: hypothetical protein ACLQVY_21905 [Limisphaerales bacterium]